MQSPKKADPIDSALLEKRENLKSQIDPINEQINTRLDYIFKKIHSAFDKPLNYWHFFNAMEGEVGDIDRGYKYGDDQICAEHYPAGDMFIILKNGDKEEEWDLATSIPAKWLTSSTFEDDLSEGLKLYKDKIKKKLENKKKTKKEKREAFLFSLKGKISKEEMQKLKKYIK